MGAGLGLADELDPFLNQGLPCLVRRMGLARDDELHRALRIGQQAQQPLRIVQQQIRSLVGREAARKTQCQGIGIEEMLRPVHRLGRRAGGGQLPGQSLAGVFDERLAGGGAKLPEPGVGDAANVLLQGVPSSPASAPLPQASVHRSSAAAESQVGIWTPLVTCPTGTSSSGQCGKSGCKEVPAHLPVQATHAIHRPAPADRQIRHVERFRRVVRILAAQGQQIVEWYAELLLGIPTEVLLDEGRSEPVKAGGHCRVGGEEVPRSRDGQRDVEGLPGLLHETAGAFQHGEGRMPFIQVTDFRLNAERARAVAIRRSRGAVPA